MNVKVVRRVTRERRGNGKAESKISRRRETKKNVTTLTLEKKKENCRE